MTTSDLLLHPVRFRIVRAFLGERALTTSQLRAELGDVPAGSLYRHVAQLTSAGVLQVVAERRVRGTTERTYMLRMSAARIDAAEAAAMSLEDHAQAFRLFITGILDDFDRYLATNDVDPVRDGVSYSSGALWLNDDEYREFLGDLAALVRPRMANPPAKGRRRRLIYSALLPAPGELPGTPTRSARPPRTRDSAAVAPASLGNP